MANIKITELTNLTDPSTTDVMPVVDVDADVTKKVSVGEVVGKITGDVDVATDGTATISELPVSKLADGTARQLLQTDAAGTGVEWTSNVDVPGTLDVTGATTLASAAVSDLTEDRVVIAGASGELEDSANLTFDGSELGITGTLDVSSNGTIGGDLTVVGDLTVEGATTTLETQTVVVEDKNIELGVVGTPTDTTADGGGITLKGATDKTINWINATDAWTFSEHVDIASAKEFRIAGTKVLDATSLGSAVVSSSLTSVGTLTSGELGSGFTTVATGQGGTGQTTYSDGELLIGKTDGTLAKATLTGGTGVDVTNADGSVTVAIDSTVVTTSDTGTVTSTMIEDDTIVDGDINASAAIADTKLATIGTAGKVSNSATTATDANTASAIVARDASGNFTAGTITADLTGNADTATALETARDIGGVSFDGTANINLPGVNTAGNQDTSGNAATATKLDSSRTFEVTGDVTGTVSSDLTSGASIATSIASGVIVDADINASAAIAGTKIDPDFGSQTIKTTGDIRCNGVYGETDTNTSIQFPGSDVITFNEGGSEAARIDSSGRLLVGTSSSISINNENTQIQLVGNTSGTSRASFVNTESDANGSGLLLGKSRGGAIVQDGDQIGVIAFNGHDGTDYTTQAARISAHVDGTPGANDMPGRLVFSTTADGASSPTERMRIRQSGEIWFNTTTGTIDTSNHGVKLQNNGVVRLSGDTNSTQVSLQVFGTSGEFKVLGDGDCENTNNSYSGISDIKLKENIVDASSQWDDLKALQVRNYNFKAETGFNTHTQIGLIAQEVELVSPGLVGESIDEETGESTKSVNYSVLYMKAVKALQEAMERIEVLEAKVNALEGN